CVRKGTMTCKECKELMPDLAAGLCVAEPDFETHLQSCSECATELKELGETMALMDEWTAPEPSPFFDVRLRARLRDEVESPRAGWLQWFRKPVLAGAFALMMVASVTVIRFSQPGHKTTTVAVVAEPGTAVGDLQTLDKNNDIFSDFDVLDDLQVQDGT